MLYDTNLHTDYHLSVPAVLQCAGRAPGAAVVSLLPDPTSSVSPVIEINKLSRNINVKI